MDCKLKIKECREARGMTQRQLSERLGIARSSVAKWELGMANPSADKIPVLASILCVSVGALYGMEPP